LLKQNKKVRISCFLRIPMAGCVFDILVSVLSNFCECDLHVEIIIFVSQLNRERSERKKERISFVYIIFKYRNDANNIHHD